MGKGMISIGKKRKITKLTRNSLDDIDEITWYLENNLDVTEYYDKKIEEQTKNFGRPKKKK